MHATLRFWLERGVDGFRMDVIHCIGKDPALPDVPAERAIIPACALNDVEVDARPAARHPARARGLPGRARDGGRGRRAVDRRRWRATTGTATSCISPSTSRRSSRPGRRTPGASRSSGRRASSTRAAPGRPGCSRTTTTRATARAMGARRGRAPPPCCCSDCAGTPFLYAGEELGLEDAQVPAARVLDPGGRDGCRAPIPWEAGPTHGWITADAVAAVAARSRAPQRRRPARGSRVDPAPVSAAARRPPRLAGIARGLAHAARRARGRARVGARPGGRSPARARELHDEPAEVAVAGELAGRGRERWPRRGGALHGRARARRGAGPAPGSVIFARLRLAARFAC